MIQFVRQDFLEITTEVFKIINSFVQISITTADQESQILERGVPRGGVGLVGISASIAYYLIEVGYQVGYHSGVEQNRAFNPLILLFFLIQFAGLSLRHTPVQ